jgi:hypothetical protein
VHGLDQLTSFRKADGSDHLVLVFKLISARAHSKHLDYVNFKMQSEAVVVAPHQCDVIDFGTQELEVRTTPMLTKASMDDCSSVIGLSLASLTAEQLHDVYQWQYKHGDILIRWRDYIFDGVSGECKEAVFYCWLPRLVCLLQHCEKTASQRCSSCLKKIMLKVHRLNFHLLAKHCCSVTT